MTKKPVCTKLKHVSYNQQIDMNVFVLRVKSCFKAFVSFFQFPRNVCYFFILVSIKFQSKFLQKSVGHLSLRSVSTTVGCSRVKLKLDTNLNILYLMFFSDCRIIEIPSGCDS